MASRYGFSAQTLSVLAALCDQPSEWQHGYALAKQTGLKSGTLYPILIRLADRGLVEACWQDEPQPGRPRRHLYRLTAAGLASATGAIASTAGPAAEPVAARAGKDAGGHADGTGRPRRGGGGDPVNRLNRAVTAAGHGAVRLLPPVGGTGSRRSGPRHTRYRRDWRGWPGGRAGLDARAGSADAALVRPRRGVRGGRCGRSLGRLAGPSVLHADADQFGVIATVLLLAGMPLLARRLFGPVSDSRTGRFLRVGGYAAILALMPAMAVVALYPLTCAAAGFRPARLHRGRKHDPRDAGHLGRGSSLAGRDLFPGLDGRLRGHPPLGDFAAFAGDPGHAGRRHRRGPRVRPGHVLGGPARTHARTPPIRGCRDRRSIRSSCSRGSCCSAGRWRPGCWPPGGTAAGRAAPPSWPRPGWARASWPGPREPGQCVVRYRCRHRDHRADD